MPPRVERFSPEVPVEKTGYFWLQLDADQETFDADTFDQWAKALKDPKNPTQTEDRFTLKWIVRGKRMIFFPSNQRHAVINYAFEYRKDGSELKAAGHLNMDKDPVTGVYRRTVWGSSNTLESLLLEEASNNFKLNELPQKLNPLEGKPFFIIG